MHNAHCTEKRAPRARPNLSRELSQTNLPTSMWQAGEDAQEVHSDDQQDCVSRSHEASVWSSRLLSDQARNWMRRTRQRDVGRKPQTTQDVVNVPKPRATQAALPDIPASLAQEPGLASEANKSGNMSSTLHAHSKRKARPSITRAVNQGATQDITAIPLFKSPIVT